MSHALAKRKTTQCRAASLGEIQPASPLPKEHSFGQRWSFLSEGALLTAGTHLPFARVYWFQMM